MPSVAILQALRTPLSLRDPYVSGTCPIPTDDFIMYYGPENDARRIDLSKATAANLAALANACNPATFGVHQKDVLDESYRKAGKMDASDFASKFSLERSGIMDHVRAQLVEGQGQVQAELYKLNVYGKDSFFKAHKDTPRGASMFASLVIVFPSEHAGGALLLRHEDNEWSFDAAKELAKCTKPSVGFVAFYSDVEHEVTTVTSGYRVTLTFNLYHANTVSNHMLDIQEAPSPGGAVFKAALQELLKDTNVLPEGGLLGFGLHHEYPVSENTELSSLLNVLKGSDAVLRRICNELSLQPELRFVYKDSWEESHMISTRYIDLSEYEQVEEGFSWALREHGGIKFLEQTPGGEWKHRDDDMRPKVGIYWATELTDATSLRRRFIAYGNEPSYEYYYARICLVVEVGPPGEDRIPE